MSIGGEIPLKVKDILRSESRDSSDGKSTNGYADRAAVRSEIRAISKWNPWIPRAEPQIARLSNCSPYASMQIEINSAEVIWDKRVVYNTVNPDKDSDLKYQP